MTATSRTLSSLGRLTRLSPTTPGLASTHRRSSPTPGSRSVDDLDPGVGEDRRCVEASPGVVGDNRVSLPKDDSVRDLAVIRVVQPIVEVPILWSLDLRAGEGALHLVEQTAAVFLAVPPSPLRIESRQHVVQLEGDAGAPEWRASLFGCELEKEVPLTPRHQGAGVENGAVHVTSLSEDPLSLIHISEPTRLLSSSYAVVCLKTKK